jgi:hypothetical protein
MVGSILLTVGCGSGDDDDDNSPTPTPSATGTPEPTFTWIEANILPGCGGVSCHGSTSPAPILNYGDLVGAMAENGCAGQTRVVANDSANSLFYTKLAGTQPCGSRMPLSGGFLPADEIQAVKDWIDAGAANN